MIIIKRFNFWSIVNSKVELFAHFGLESGMVFEGITCLSFQFQMTKKEEKYAYSKWI